MQKLVSIREFARCIGVSDTAVRKAIKSGRITKSAMDGSKLIFATAEEQFKKNRDISKTRKPKAKPQKKQSEIKKPKIIQLSEIKAQSIPDYDDEQEEKEDRGVISRPSQVLASENDLFKQLNAQKIRTETVKADTAELKYQKLKGELVEVEKVNIAIFELLRGLRDHWLIFPDRVSADMAAKLGVSKTDLKNMLSEEIKNHLHQTEDLSFEIQTDDS